jgi:hypothetical protein
MDPTFWQIPAGPTNRNYTDIFIKHGVALIGPGEPGAWNEKRPDEDFGGRFVRCFASEIQHDDIIVLRTGIKAVHAIGIVVGPYEHLEQFDDVNGWDLQHARRVRWLLLLNDQTFDRPVFGANPPRISRINDLEVINFVKSILNSPPSDWKIAPLPPLPNFEISMEDIPLAIAEIVAMAKDFCGQVWPNLLLGDMPSEQEMIAHFVIPVLRALGWPPELIAVEWRNVDVALFQTLPRTPENCILIIEAKRIGSSVEGALLQAQGYAKALQTSCDAMVTDGIRYRLFSPSFQRKAYANLILLKSSAKVLFDSLRKH